jgi:hypothetical protein
MHWVEESAYSAFIHADVCRVADLISNAKNSPEMHNLAGKPNKTQAGRQGTLALG